MVLSSSLPRVRSIVRRLITQPTKACSVSSFYQQFLFHHSRRGFATYEGRGIADEELIKESDDWAVEETNFCLGRFPSHTYFPETADLARRTMQLMETQKCRMFTRLRDGTVIPVMSQMVHYTYDKPDTMFNYFERPVIKYTWDETYDDAWEEETPEFEEGELPFAEKPPGEPKPSDPALAELELIRRTTGGI